MKDHPFSSIRREYGAYVLQEDTVAEDPITQFNVWFNEILSEEPEPTAMTLATVDSSGMPDARVVLLKGINEEGAFIFYTHYDSAKGSELAQSPKAALNFFWMTKIRQVKIRGTVQKVPESVSDDYFKSRPRSSQLSAIASHQSQVLKNRSELENKITELAKYYEQESVIPRPKQWGGYAVLPVEIEFWQGRDNRVHDRLCYRKVNDAWVVERLSP